MRRPRRPKRGLPAWMRRRAGRHTGRAMGAEVARDPADAPHAWRAPAPHLAGAARPIRGRSPAVGRGQGRAITRAGRAGDGAFSAAATSRVDGHSRSSVTSGRWRHGPGARGGRGALRSRLSAADRADGPPFGGLGADPPGAPGFPHVPAHPPRRSAARRRGGACAPCRSPHRGGLPGGRGSSRRTAAPTPPVRSGSAR